MKHRSIVLVALLSIAVFSGLAVFGDLPALVGSVLALHPKYWLATMGLTLGHILLRLVRWNYYLRVLGIAADAKTSTLILLSSLSMIMVPGRIGELGKSYFLKRKLGIPVRLSAPVVITERIGDVISVLFLGLWGLIFIPYAWIVIPLILFGLASILMLLASPKGIRLLIHLPLLRSWEPILSDSGRALRTLFSPRVMMVGLLLGCLIWISLGISFWVVLKGLGTGTTMPLAVSIFCATTLIGSVSMLPGGLVTTEGGMLILLQRVGLGSTMASASILITRVCTLWFAVIIGLVALFFLYRHQPTRTRAPSDAFEYRPTTSLLERELVTGNEA